MKKIFIAVSLACLSLASIAQRISADKIILRPGGDLVGKAGASIELQGYVINGFSNDPALADSSTIQLVTEAAAKAYSDTKGRLDSLVLLQDSILVAYNAAGSEIFRDTIAGAGNYLTWSDTTTLATQYDLSLLPDSSLLSTDYERDTAAANIRAEIAALPDSTLLSTDYQRDTAAANIRAEIAALPDSTLLSTDYERDTAAANIRAEIAALPDSTLLSTDYQRDTAAANIRAEMAVLPGDGDGIVSANRTLSSGRTVTMFQTNPTLQFLWGSSGLPGLRFEDPGLGLGKLIFQAPNGGANIEVETGASAQTILLSSGSGGTEMEITSNDGIKVSGDAMKYTFDNEAYLESNDRHIPDVGTVKSMINDTIPDVSGFVEYADSNDVFVTPAQLGDSLAAFSGGDNLGSHTATDSLDMSGFRIYNLDEPVASDDAATKNYVDENAVTGLQAAIDKQEELDGGGYLYVEFPSGAFVEDDASTILWQAGGGGNNLKFSTSSGEAFIEYVGDDILVADQRTTKKGIEYTDDYSADLKTNARSIPDVGTVAEIIADSLAALGVGGDDLGSHTATQDLDLDGNSILNADTITLTDATGDLASIVPGSLNADRTYTLINRSGEIALRTIEVETYNTSATHVIKSTDDYIRVDGSAGAQTYTLPTATEGRVLIFKRIDNNPATTITFTGTVDGAVNPISTTGGSPIEVLATQYGFTTLVGNGTSWEKIN